MHKSLNPEPLDPKSIKWEQIMSLLGAAVRGQMGANAGKCPPKVLLTASSPTAALSSPPFERLWEAEGK